MTVDSLRTSSELNAQFGRSRHVLTLTPFYPFVGNEGVGCFVAEPLPLLPPLGIENEVIAARPFYYGAVDPSREAVPAHWSRFFAVPGNPGLPLAGAFLFSALLSRVRSLHQRHPFDLIHAHSALPCGHAAALLGRELQIPFVVTVHGLDAFFSNQIHGFARKWGERVARMIYRSACRVICVSEKVEDQVLLGLPVAKTAVVNNGVNPQMFAPAKDPGAPCRTILSVGTLNPTKGHDLLVRAFAAVHQRFPDISLEIIGEGPDLAQLRGLAASLNIADKVRFLGRQTRGQVADAMRRCTLFALLSRYEALGCVYLEAMSTGKAVIACRGQGIEEVIEHGRNGWLTGPDDLEELTQTLVDLLPEPRFREQLGEAARQTILHNFTLAHQAARLAQLYRECSP